MEKPQTWLAVINEKHIYNGQITDVFFYVYLLNIKTKIVKMITTIVSAIKPNKRRLIIAINATSTICTTSVLVKL